MERVMKIKPDHYQVLKTGLTAVLNTYPHRQEDYEKQGLSHTRFVWDTFYLAKIKIGDGVGMPGLPLYGYLNDSHIDTALKHIIKNHVPKGNRSIHTGD
jgi:hypothetical protein